MSKMFAPKPRILGYAFRWTISFDYQKKNHRDTSIHRKRLLERWDYELSDEDAEKLALAYCERCGDIEYKGRCFADPGWDD